MKDYKMFKEWKNDYPLLKDSDKLRLYTKEELIQAAHSSYSEGFKHGNYASDSRLIYTLASGLTQNEDIKNRIIRAVHVQLQRGLF